MRTTRTLTRWLRWRMACGLGGGMLAACGSGSGGSADLDAQSGADVQLDAAADTLADAGTDAAAVETLGDTQQCLGLMAACTDDADCCAPWRCLNITGTSKCQEEGPIQDVQVSELPAADAATDVADVPDASQDSGSELPPSDACAASDAVPAPSCGTGFFPAFSRSCSQDADCVVAVHQVNCCGTQVAWGLNACEQAAFTTAEQQCQSQYPACGCAAFQTQAEDGFGSWDANSFAARCDAGTCRSYVPGAKPVCGSAGLEAPAPVKACTVDADCDFSIHQVDCCGSTVFTGIAKFAKPAFDAAEQACTSGGAICDCMPKPSTTDDGQPLTTSAVPVHCQAGKCATGSAP